MLPVLNDSTELQLIKCRIEYIERFSINKQVGIFITNCGFKSNSLCETIHSLQSSRETDSQPIEVLRRLVSQSVSDSVRSSQKYSRWWLECEQCQMMKGITPQPSRVIYEFRSWSRRANSTFTSCTQQLLAHVPDQ